MSYVSPRREYDEVELHAERDGNELTIFLCRATATAQQLELESCGWICEIHEVERDGPTDGPGAWSRWTAVGRTTQIAAAATGRLAYEFAHLSADVGRSVASSAAARDRRRSRRRTATHATQVGPGPAR